METLKNVFGSGLVLIVSLVIFIMGQFISNNSAFKNNNATMWLIVILVIALFVAFKLHESNVQKALISAVFVLLIEQMAVRIFIEGELMPKAYYISYTVIYVLMYIMYLVMQSDKLGRKRNINIMYFIFLIFIILTIYWMIKLNVMVAANFSTMLFMTSIITKIQVYKEMRHAHIENGTWDEKAKKEAKRLFNI